MMRKLRSTFISFAIAAILVAGVALPAQAAFIDLTGFVNYFDPANQWGINGSSSVTGTATWDETLLVNTGLEDSSNFQDASMNLKVFIGGFSYDFLTDNNFKTLDFGFSNGFLQQIALFGTVGTGPDYDTFDISFDYFANANVFSLDFGQVTGEMAPVPEPGTFLLLGAGLGGLLYVQRRRKNG